MSVDERDRAAALANRSRRRVFDAINDAHRPIGVSELALICGIHPNTVRLHLERLVSCGLVTQAPGGLRRRPGRPPHRYVATVGAAADEAGTYRHLAGVLAKAVREGTSAREAGRAMVASIDEVGGPDAVVSAMAAAGFRPVLETSGERTEVVLRACPFADIAAEDPETICQLHLGMAEAVADAVGDVLVERLVMCDPFEAGCRLVLRRYQAG